MGIFHFPGDTHPFFLPTPALTRHFYDGYSLKNCVYPPFWLLYCICGQCSWGGYLPVFWKYPSHCYLSCKAPSVTTSVSTFVKSSVNHLSQILLDHRNKWPTPYFLEIMVEAGFSCLPPPLKQRKRCVTIRKNRGGRAVLLFSTPLTTRKKASTDGKIMVETCFHHRPPPLKAIKDISNATSTVNQGRWTQAFYGFHHDFIDF